VSPDNPGWYFAVALVTSFIATLPFGPINLTVIKTTVDHNRPGALQVSFAAALVETGQAFLAIWFGVVISRFLADHASINLALALVFVALGVYVWIHETHPSLNSNSDVEPSYIRRGLFIALVNPQAIPFWIIAVTATTRYLGFDFAGWLLVAYLLGVFSGKVVALWGFTIASDYLKAHLDESSRLVNRLLAVVLFFIGSTQLWRAVVNW